MYNLFIFFRDLRLKDNIGLTETLKKNKNIIPIFIFIDEQINPNKNKYYSSNCVQFMCESLNDLNNQLINCKTSELNIFYGSSITQVLENICKIINIEGIYYNKDYTPYALKREQKIEKWCKINKKNHYVYEDYLLAPIGSFLKNDEKYYEIHTPFKNNVYKKINLINKPLNKYVKNLSSVIEIKKSKYYLSISQIKKFYNNNNNILVHGGRQNAIKLLNKSKNINYDVLRNDLEFNTSHLSAYIKFGNISIREVFWFYYKNKQQGLMDQIVWREFYYYILYYNPRLLTKGENYNKKYDKIKWNHNKKHLDYWKVGNTGYPVVDACMKELNTTGYMHNRGRLISSNFLNRMLGQDWRNGEKYFAEKLTDYDPCVNNGNWQWIASTGTDPKPYFQRLFNPWIQSEKYDKDANYIKKWLPQLKNIPANHLHNWDKYCVEYDLEKINYSKPIVNYNEARKNSILQYKI